MVSRVDFLMFPGQGSQKVGMGVSLAKTYREARDLFGIADEILGYCLSQICFRGPPETLMETRFCQPALYVLGYVIFDLLKREGLLGHLRYVLGLSLGEWTALAAAEAFDFEVGLRLVQARANEMQEACERTEGGMLSLIGGSLRDVEILCKAYNIDISNRNCPGQIVVSGPKKILRKVAADAPTMNIRKAIPLNVAGPYHSRWMRTASERFARLLRQYSFKKPIYTVISNTSAGPISDPESLRRALCEQSVSTVLWEPSLNDLAQKGALEGLECGPGGVLTGLAKRTHAHLRVQSVCESDDVAALRDKIRSVGIRPTNTS
jgi:[acyl-carrier-protein] S-malonyltransferase